MTDIINGQVPLTTEEIVALKAATKEATLKGALRNAVEYRIRGGKVKA